MESFLEVENFMSGTECQKGSHEMDMYSYCTMFKGLKANNEQQDNMTGILHQGA